MALGVAALLLMGAPTAGARDPFPGPTGAVKGLGLPGRGPDWQRGVVQLTFAVADPALGGTWQMSFAAFAWPPHWTPDGQLGGATLNLPHYQCAGQLTPGDPSDDVFTSVTLTGRPNIQGITGTFSPLLLATWLAGTLTFPYWGSVSCPAGASTITGTFSANARLVVIGVGPVSVAPGSSTGYPTDVQFGRGGIGWINVAGVRVALSSASMQREMAWT
jgi:hypothetical protein